MLSSYWNYRKVTIGKILFEFFYLFIYLFILFIYLFIYFFFGGGVGGNVMTMNNSKKKARVFETEPFAASQQR